MVDPHELLLQIIKEKLDYHKEGMMGRHTHTDLMAIGLLETILEEYEKRIRASWDYCPRCGEPLFDKHVIEKWNGRTVHAGCEKINDLQIL